MENTQENLTTTQMPTKEGFMHETVESTEASSTDAAKEVPIENTTTLSTVTALVEAQTQITKLQAEITELQENFLRAKAETENTRRRAQEDVSKAHKFAIENFAEHLLPVLDSLEAAIMHESDDVTTMRKGVELTLRQLIGALEKGRIITVNPVGEKFDPHLHQAISIVPADQEPNTVVSVLQKGYTISDRMLRPAIVTVTQSK